MSRAPAWASLVCVSLTLFAASAVDAVESCKAKQAKDGTLLVSAKKVVGTLRFGYSADRMTTVFANGDDCVQNGTARNCTLADAGSPTRTTPPPFCKVYVRDSSVVSCEAPLKRCTPGKRAVCPPDMERIGAECIERTFNTATTYGNATQTCSARGRALCRADTLLTCDTVDLSSARLYSCGWYTDQGDGWPSWTSGSNAEGGDVSDRLIVYDGDNLLIEADSASADSSFGYFCCAPLGTP